MKVFWGILGLLVVFTAVLFVRRGGEQETAVLDRARGPNGAATQPSGQSRPESASPEQFEGDIDLRPSDIDRLASANASSANAGTETPGAPDELDAMTAELERSLYENPLLTLPETSSPFAGSDSTALPTPGGQQAPTSKAPKTASAAPADSAAKSATAAALDQPPPKAVILRRDDGSILVDDRFVLKGTGTQTDPIQITWEFLVSAQETYQPRLGRKHLPDRMTLVHDKWVSISGYIAFPIMASSPDEMLMMLNQWDGCCIGVPPTPYDAIEVKLATPANSQQKLAVDGTIKGILRVDPYLIKDWLVSLYLMDDATLTRDSASENRAIRPPLVGEHTPGTPAQTAPTDGSGGGKNGGVPDEFFDTP